MKCLICPLKLSIGVTKESGIRIRVKKDMTAAVKIRYHSPDLQKKSIQRDQ